MKIRKIVAAGLRGATPAGGWSNELKPDDCVHTLIAVHTDEGLVGWGSSFSSDALVNAALQVLEPLYLGETALEPERVTEKMHQNTFWLGRGGSITHTISGIDIALWDLLGKATGQPVGRLLGGRHRERVLPYASILMKTPALLRDHLLAVRSQGFRAIKIGWGPFGRVNDRLDEEIIRIARDTIGEDCFLMVDAGGSDAFWTNSYKWALRTSEMLAEYGVYWFEEPLQPDARSDYIALRGSSRVPIAGGEVMTRWQAFKPWLDSGAFDIVQPDVTKVGGISDERRIGWMAQENGVQFIPHGWNTALGLATDLQLASAFHHTDLVEYLNGSPFVDEIATTPWKLDADGMLAIPNLPGLGIDVNRDAVARYTRGINLFQ